MICRSIVDHIILLQFSKLYCHPRDDFSIKTLKFNQKFKKHCETKF